jgi:hypothetical protein
MGMGSEEQQSNHISLMTQNGYFNNILKNKVAGEIGLSYGQKILNIVE